MQNGPEEEVAIVGTLPATGEYEWTNLPGSCDSNQSSISQDKLTLTCVRNNFTNTATYAEDLLFTARVLGGTPNGATPGDISFEVSGQNATTVSDDTDGYSLTVTASPRWNLQKGLYRSYTGMTYDDDGDPNTPEVDGYILNYIFYIKTDEVVGTTDNTYSLLGNESMGNDVTFTFTDQLDEISPNAQLVRCDMNGRYDVQDGYVGSANPITFSGPGSIHEANTDQHIPQNQGV